MGVDPRFPGTGGTAVTRMEGMDMYWAGCCGEQRLRLEKHRSVEFLRQCVLGLTFEAQINIFK